MSMFIMKKYTPAHCFLASSVMSTFSLIHLIRKFPETLPVERRKSSVNLSDVQPLSFMKLMETSPTLKKMMMVIGLQVRLQASLRCLCEQTVSDHLRAGTRNTHPCGAMPSCPLSDRIRGEKRHRCPLDFPSKRSRLGVYCNQLVCDRVWLCIGVGRSEREADDQHVWATWIHHGVEYGQFHLDDAVLDRDRLVDGTRWRFPRTRIAVCSYASHSLGCPPWAL